MTLGTDVHGGCARRKFRIIAAAVCLLALTLFGCSEREFVDVAPRQSQDGTEPWSSGPVRANMDSAAAPGIAECMAFENAPPSSSDALIGTWGYVNAMIYWAGYDPDYAEASGTLVLGADGRYDIDREMEGTGLEYGSGDWTFDGATLTLVPDDGTDPDNYNHVIATDFGLTLVNADETGCLVYFLGRQS